MTLDRWLGNSWIKQEASGAAEIQALLEKVDRDISDGCVTEITADWRLAMAYSACLGCATVALRCNGYRMSQEIGHHHRTIESLRLTLKPDTELLTTIQAIRRKRNVVTYDSAGTVSETEVAEALSTARQLRKQLTHWLQSNFPQMLSSAPS